MEDKLRYGWKQKAVEIGILGFGILVFVFVVWRPWDTACTTSACALRNSPLFKTIAGLLLILFPIFSIVKTFLFEAWIEENDIYIKKYFWIRKIPMEEVQSLKRKGNMLDPDMTLRLKDGREIAIPSLTSPGSEVFLSNFDNIYPEK